MGKKMNNMPIRKKKLKDKNNLQIQGRGGLGRKREKGRLERQKERGGGISQRMKQSGKKASGQEEPQQQLSWIERARLQEERALAETKQEESTGTSKSAKRKRKRAGAEERKPAAMEKSHMQKKETLRQGAVYVGTGISSDDEPDKGKGGGATSSNASADPLVPGAIVTLVDLQKAPQLNGKHGICVAWNSERGRWLVRVEGKEQLLRPENLRKQATTVANGFPLCAGAYVQIQGLQGARALNGQFGTCMSWSGERQRWSVLLSGAQGGEEKSIKVENLVFQPRAGRCVKLHGLVKASELNNRCGMVIGWSDTRKRWRVRLEDGEEKALQASNLAAFGSQDPAPVDPRINQVIQTCKEEEVLSKVLETFKKGREDERRGRTQRRLAVVFCNDLGSEAHVAEALKRLQFPCISLSNCREHEVADHYNVDDKWILVCTDEAFAGVKPQHPIHMVFHVGFPSSLETYRERLQKSFKEKDMDESESYTSTSFFVPSPAKKDLGTALLGLLQRCHGRIDPAFMEAIRGKQQRLAEKRRAKRQERSVKRKLAKGAALNGPAGDDAEEGKACSENLPHSSDTPKEGESRAESKPEAAEATGSV